MESMPLHGADAEATTATELAPAIELGRVRHLLTEHADVIALVMITAVAAGVRFATLGMQGLDHDESVTAAGVLHPSIGGTISAVAQLERTPPLYYMLEWLWTQALGFGTDPANLRFLSAVFGTLTVPVAFLAARELSSRRAGVMTAALVALNPFLVWYSQEARAYALLVLFIALGLYVFARALSKPTRGRLAVWALVSILAIFTHYFAVFTVVPEAAWLFWAVRPRRRPFAAIAAVGVAGGALLPLAVTQQGSNATEWFKQTSILTRAWQTPVHFASTVKPEIPSPQAWTAHLQIAAAMFAAAILLAGAAALAPRGERRDGRGARVVFALAAASFCLPIAVAFAGADFLDARNLIGALLVLLVGAGIVFGAVRPRIAGTLATAAICALFAGLLVVSASTSAMQRPHYQGAAGSIGRSSVKRMVVVPRTSEPPLSYYLGAQRADGVGRPVWVREIELYSSAPTHDAPQAPFRLVGERSTQNGMWVSRYESPRPVRVWLSPAHATHMIGEGAGALVTLPPITAAAP
jgi:4-amino-4-deoxy-L-arabinose transferase-like glycosyltransferase